MDNIENVKHVKPTVKLGDLDFTSILVTLIAVFVTILVLYLWKKKSFIKSDVLLTGLCESGKTVLFGQILQAGIRETFTTISENIGEFKGESNASARLIDIPGHERLRLRFYDQYKATTKGIVYLIDSVTVQKDIRDVTDFLYTILADPATSSVPVLILCNKQDETLAKGSSVIKSLLEKEINLLRTTRENQLKSVDNSTSAQTFIGKAGKDFEFAHLPRTIEVAECAGREGEIDSVTDWLNRIC